MIKKSYNYIDYMINPESVFEILNLPLRNTAILSNTKK